MSERNKNGQFIKGHSPVPGAGRPLGTVDIQNYIRSISNNMEDYIFMLDEIVRNPKTKIKEKINCIQTLLDRSLGKSQLYVSTEGSLDIVVGLPNDLQEE